MRHCLRNHRLPHSVEFETWEERKTCTTVSRAKPSASVTHANPLVALSTMGDKPAEGYYAGSLYTGIALVVIALLNIILYSVAVRTPTRPTFPTHMTPARAR